MSESQTAGEEVVRALQGAGARTLFTLNGGHIWPVLDAARRLGMRVVDTRDERTAAFAAEATSKLTRTCGFAAVTAGPGVTNALTALAGSWANDSPLFLFGGRAGSARWGQGQLQEMDHLALVGPLTREAATLAEGGKAFETASRLVARAWSRRTGPVFMDAPVEVLFGAVEVGDVRTARGPDPGPGPDPEQAALAARLLGEAARPVMVVGQMAWWARCEEAVKELAERAVVPVYTAGQARGMVPGGHRLRFSRSRPAALGRADLVLLVGAPLDFRLGFGEPPLVNPSAKLVYVDADAAGKARAPAVALYGDMRAALGELAARAWGGRGREAWLAELRGLEEAAAEADRPLLQSDRVPVHPARLVAEVAGVLDPDAVVIGDGGDFVSFAGRFIERPRPGLWLDPGPFGALGTGAGYAMAARLAYPDRQVVLLSGDGAFGFSALDFDTLVRHHLPVVSVVGNNGGWALEDHPMRRLFGEAVASRLGPKTRYDKLVESLGGHGELVERPQHIRGALERALRAGVPACVNVICDPEAAYPRSSVLM